LATQYGNVNKIFNDNYMPIENLLSGVVINLGTAWAGLYILILIMGCHITFNYK